MLCESRVVKRLLCPSFFLPSLVFEHIPRFILVPILACATIGGTPLLSGQEAAPQAQVSADETTRGAISGIVLAQGNNRPVPNAVVSLRSDSAGISQNILTDAGGQFDVQGIPQGKYTISINEPGYESFRANEQVDRPLLKVLLYLTPTRPAQAGRSAYTVSVRELKIPGKAQGEFRKGLERLAKNDLPESLNHFLKATRAFSEYYEAYYHAGFVQLKMGRKDEAMQSFQEAIDRSGGHYARAQFGMGYLLYLESQPGEAEKVLRRGLEMDGNLPEGHAILGMVLLQLDRVEEAEKSAHEALLLNPNFAQAYLVLSEVYARRQEYRQQLQDLNSYLKLQPTGPESERAQRARATALTMLAQANSQN